MSVMAGITENYLRGITSGVTLRWVVEVWDLYADTIFLSILLSIACLICTIVLGVPAAYVLSKRQGRVARMIEELLTLPICNSGPGHRFGTDYHLWRFSGFSFKLAVYPGWTRPVYLAVYDAISSCRHVIG